MLELLAMYQAMPPLAVGLLLLPLGLAVGSFTTVALYRIPQHRSLITPRSYCPACGHTLTARELFPLLSFLWQRGKCRACGASIPIQYPILEAGSGFAVGAAGVLGGWIGGLSLAAIFSLGAVALGFLRRHHREEGQTGFSIVEVLVAMLIVTLALTPALETIAVARHAGKAGQRRSAALGLARAKISELAELGWNHFDTVQSGTTTTYSSVNTGESVDNYRVVATVTLRDTLTKTVTVTVDCSDCKARFGMAVPPVELQTTIRKGSGP